MLKARLLSSTGLRSKEENMQELVRLAEVREAQAKEQMTALLSSRSNMFQSQQATSEGDADLGSIEQQIEEAQRTKALAKKKFNKARSVCIGAHQVQAPACAVSDALGMSRLFVAGVVNCISKHLLQAFWFAVNVGIFTVCACTKPSPGCNHP